MKVSNILLSFILLGLSLVFGFVRIEVLKRTAPTGCESSRLSIKGDTVIVHYEAYIDDTSPSGVPGTRFDSSYSRSVPETIFLGGEQVTEGFEQALMHMCKGEKRSIRIPPELGFGSHGAPPHVPPHAVLRYEIHCISVRDPIAREKLLKGNIWKLIDKNKDWIATPAELEAYDPATHFLSDDFNQDGVLSWEEFSGPKGRKGPKGWDPNKVVPNAAYHALKSLEKESSENFNFGTDEF